MDSRKQKTDNESGIEKIAKELNVALPSGQMPAPVKLIALFTLVGGLSIIGSIFADVVAPDSEKFGIYILRLIVGLLSVGIAYGIADKRRWALWLYGLIVITGFSVNPVVAILPLGILAYLYKHKELFRLSVFDKILNFLVFAIKETLGSFFKKDQPEQKK